MNSNALKVLELLNTAIRAGIGFQIAANNYQRFAQAQAELLSRAQAEGRDVTDAELAQARAFAMDQKHRRDELLAQDAAADLARSIAP